MNTTRGNRLHIGFFGKRNVGKSSLINKIIGQELSIVSDVPGTTTDVNHKAMELLPLGPVVLLDTAGIDDVGDLGGLRIQKTYKALERVDVAVIVFDNKPLLDGDFNLIGKIKEKNIPLLVVLNKADIGLMPENDIEKLDKYADFILKLSAQCDKNIPGEFTNALIKILPDEFIKTPSILSDIVKPLDTVVLVIPIDKEAPKNRLILPQANVLRELLEIGAISLCVNDFELKDGLNNLKKLPKIVITDSQAFKKVSEIVPNNVNLTSFSILFARLKGDLKIFLDGAKKIDLLQDSNKILVLESCSHHPIEDDIGRVKIPNLIKKYTGKELIFEHYSGHDFPIDVSRYSLIIHCGACMTNRREVLNRINVALRNNVPITNYGISIAKCLNILDRAINPFKEFC